LIPAVALFSRDRPRTLLAASRTDVLLTPLKDVDEPMAEPLASPSPKEPRT